MINYESTPWRRRSAISGSGAASGKPHPRGLRWSVLAACAVVMAWLASSALAFDLIDIDGTNGFYISGIAGEDWQTESVSGAGDVNDDGIADIIIVVQNQTGGAEAYVVFGRSTGFPVVFDLATLDGSNGFRVAGGDEGEWNGMVMSGVGDVNSDGINDLFMSMGVMGQGTRAYVVFGSAEPFPESLDPAELGSEDAFRITSSLIGSVLTDSASKAGDVNGDGVDDMILGSGNILSYYPKGFIVFGSAAGFPAVLDVATFDGSNGFEITGDWPVWSVSGAGDVNDDGLDDVVLGGNPYVSLPGESYVVFGSAEGFPASLDLASLDGSNGFRINGVAEGDGVGWSVSGDADINADGVADLIIGAPFVYGNDMFGVGASFVVFGNSAGFPASVELADLEISDGFRLNGIYGTSLTGHSVSAAGDFNGDGLDDLMIGAPSADPNYLGSGQTYIVFGNDTGFPESFELETLDGSNGLQVNGIDAHDWAGISVSGAGDVNADGGDDVIIAARYANESYVLFGQPGPDSPEDNLEELIEEVEDIDPSLAESLERALQAIVDDNANNDKSACGQLKSFVSKVNAAERDGDLSAEEAEDLREAADGIRTDLGCS